MQNCDFFRYSENYVEQTVAVAGDPIRHGDHVTSLKFIMEVKQLCTKDVSVIIQWNLSVTTTSIIKFNACD